MSDEITAMDNNCGKTILMEDVLWSTQFVKKGSPMSYDEHVIVLEVLWHISTKNSPFRLRALIASAITSIAVRATSATPPPINRRLEGVYLSRVTLRGRLAHDLVARRTRRTRLPTGQNRAPAPDSPSAICSSRSWIETGRGQRIIYERCENLASTTPKVENVSTSLKSSLVLESPKTRDCCLTAQKEPSFSIEFPSCWISSGRRGANPLGQHDDPHLSESLSVVERRQPIPAPWSITLALPKKRRNGCTACVLEAPFVVAEGSLSAVQKYEPQTAHGERIPRKITSGE
ncbi:hypothetical protein KIN20_025663, partial [Parelaphostrongylus tenuis]